ncbi:hypothetical protein, partial [Bacillus cereus group sp. BfR-BA-01318]|uniref:hypothetical protein n=1 Tax=Bacillus cereus group sp. BfR-BA-01318 TaxID=2920295 RepID=UPI001F59C31E
TTEKNYERMERSEEGGDFCVLFAKILPVPFIIFSPPPVTSPEIIYPVKKDLSFFLLTYLNNFLNNIARNI